MADDARYSLRELERLSGVPARQIRELIRLAVVPGASSGGRGATYGREHLDRLRAWKRLRAEAPAGTTTESLRVLLERLQDARLLGGVADGKLPFTLVDDNGDGDASPPRAMPEGNRMPAAPEPAAEPPQGRNEGALQYLRSVRESPERYARMPRAADSVARPRPSPEPVARLAVGKTTLRGRLEVNLQAAQRSRASFALQRLHEALAGLEPEQAAPARPSSRADPWLRVAVGRDLEIAARGPLEGDDVRLLEAVAQLLQQTIYRRRTP